MATLEKVLSRSKISKSEFSHEITIYRKSSFLGDAQEKGAPEFLALATQSIGSYYQQSTSNVIGSGLSFEEQKLLMPPIVDCEPSDRNFREKVSNYFNTLRLVVPYKEGKKLQVGLTGSKNPFDLGVPGKDGQINMPLNPAEYILYRWALTAPKVCENKALADSNPLMDFYIFDPEAEELQMLDASAAEDRASEIYLELKNEPKMVDMILTMLNIDPRDFKGINATKMKLQKAKDLAKEKPKEFVDTFEHKFLEGRYNIQTMVNTKILTKAGKAIVNPATGETIGHDLDEAAFWLKDPENSETVVLLMARMQEAIGASVVESMNKK